MMRLLIFAWFIFSFVNAQEYVPLDTLDHESRTENKNLFGSKLNGVREDFKIKYPPGVRGELNKHLEDFRTFFVKTFDRGRYLYDTAFNEKVNEIYAEISQNNPKVPKDLQVLVSRDISLNAFCLINGTLVVNMGAIGYLENEDQLAGILCHEIAHKLLEHSENNIVQTVSEKYSSVSRKENRNLRRQKYNRQKLAFSVLKEKLFNKSRNNREQELEADSLGFLLVKNTGYRPNEFLRALELSLEFDTIKPADLDVSVYKKVFDLPDQPFDDNWLEQEDFSQYDYVFEEKISLDSLSTHPEIQDRIEKLKNNFTELKDWETNDKELENATDYQKLRMVAKKEQVPSLFYDKKYGFSIYLSLYRIQEGYMVDFHKKWLGKAFIEMYRARQDYMANKYLERIDPENQSESYQQFINFMWNLQLEEMKTIGEHYYPLDH